MADENMCSPEDCGLLKQSKSKEYGLLLEKIEELAVQIKQRRLVNNAMQQEFNAIREDIDLQKQMTDKIINEITELREQIRLNKTSGSFTGARLV